MHPEQISDSPGGRCKICGMELVKGSSVEGDRGIKLDGSVADHGH
jgi:hypothetical protein